MSFDKKKKFYAVEEKVYVKPLKEFGVIESLNIQPKTEESEGVYEASVKIGEETKIFKLWEIDKLRDDKKTLHNKFRKDRQPLDVKIRYFDNDVRIEKINIGNWIDLRAAEDITLTKESFRLIPLGVAMKLPRGYEAHIAPRSSTFKHFGIIQTNGLGIVDNSYSGNDDQWFFPAYALRDTVIHKGDRICQFRIVRTMPEINLVTVEKLTDQNRGGHGSTGRN